MQNNEWPPAPGGEKEKSEILIWLIDDRKDVADNVKDAISVFPGLKFNWFASGEEALEALVGGGAEPSVLFLDGLGEGGKKSATQVLKALTDKKSLRIVPFSSREETVAGMLSVGEKLGLNMEKSDKMFKNDQGALMDLLEKLSRGE